MLGDAPIRYNTSGQMPGFGPAGGSPSAQGTQKANERLTPWFGDAYSLPETPPERASTLFDQLMAGPYGVQMQQIQNQRDELLANAKVRDAQRQAAMGAASGAMARDNSLAKARLGLEEEGLGIDRGAANRQIEMLSRLRGLLGEDFNATNTNLDSLLRIAQGDFDRVNAYIGQQEGFAGQGRDLAMAAAGLARDSTTRQAMSAATARGASQSQGLRNTNSDILRQFGISTGNADLDYRSTLAALVNRRGENTSEWDRTQTNLGTQRTRAKIDYDRGLLGNDEDVAQRRDRLAQLDLTARDLGLRREQLDAALAKGIADLGLQGLADANSISAALASNNASAVNAAMTILQAGLQGLVPQQ